MPWLVFTTDVFNEWFALQNFSAQASILAVLQLLRDQGPQLNCPKADTLQGTKHKNLKELRLADKGSPVRLFFAFDTRRQADHPLRRRQDWRRTVLQADDPRRRGEEHEADLKKLKPEGSRE